MRLPGGRRAAMVAVGLLVFVLVAAGCFNVWRQRPPTRWPRGSDEERLAEALADHDRERDTDVIEQLLRLVGIDLFAGRSPPVSEVAAQIAKRDGAASIPLLIGIIDADNSYWTVYGVGYHVLRHPTHVAFSSLHDGAWWRRWWEANKASFPPEIRDRPIPEFDKSNHGRSYIPFPADTDTLAGKLRLIDKLLPLWQAYPRSAAAVPPLQVMEYAELVAAHGDPRAIPYLIALAGTSPHNMQETSASLRKLTGVPRQFVASASGSYQDPQTKQRMHDQTGDAGWWRQWWADHRGDYPADLAAIDVPDLARPIAIPWDKTTATGQGNVATESRP